MVLYHFLASVQDKLMVSGARRSCVKGIVSQPTCHDITVRSWQSAWRTCAIGHSRSTDHRPHISHPLPRLWSHLLLMRDMKIEHSRFHRSRQSLAEPCTLLQGAVAALLQGR